jgi:acyl-coenzyme A synthetase/AMP-(fatty) acid ligase/3-hydroxymyristoyl/3-hydroxydecanoyl-(acyl carrier protein) dehydratase
MKTIHDILDPSVPGDSPIALGPRGVCTASDFRSRIAAYRTRISETDGSRWGLYVEDVLEFGSAFFALLLEQREVVLLPHAQPGLLVELRHTVDRWMLTEPREGVPHVMTTAGLPANADPSKHAWPTQIETPFTFYTSGSTGQGKQVAKTFDQLTREVSLLDQLWGTQAGDGVVFSTVSHQHIYGFLFRFLWPLFSGRSFWTENLLFPDALQTHMAKNAQAVVVSCPAHLQRMPDLFDLAVLRQHCRLIFSSGGLLHAEHAHRIQERWKEPPIEVFGSTETGGVAHRQQWIGQPDTPWTPLATVELRQEEPGEQLSVRSPFVSIDGADADGWFAMGDNVAIHPDGTFDLLGRTDRIAKIEQKRISLNAIEQRLCDHPSVSTCAVLVLPDQGDYVRTFLGAVLVLSDKGTRFQASTTKLALTRQLKEHLLVHFEAVTLPRRWVVVQALPANAQGKCTAADLLELFADKATPQDVRLPDVLGEHVEGDQISLRCRVPEQLCYFDGHFDGQPIVPGVVQMNWAMHYAAQHFGVVTDAAAMQAIKFHNVMFPNDEFVMDLSHDREANRVTFRLALDEKAYSSGRVVLAP